MTPYRLILDRAGWDSLPERLDDPFFYALAATNRRALDLLRELPLSQEPAPKRLDDPSSVRSASPWRVTKVRLARGAVAWWLERRQQDADDLIAAVDHLITEDWGVIPSSADNGLPHFDLRTGDIAWEAAFACDVLAEVIGPQRVAALQNRLANELLPHYLAGVTSQEWWSACDFNWAGGTHAQAGFAALAIAEDYPDISTTVLATVRRGLVPFLEAFPADGAWCEGMMYQTTSLAHTTDFVAALERVTGDDLGLSKHLGFTDCLRYRQEQLGGDSRPFNFSNINEHTIECYLPQAYWWARRLNEPELTAFEDTQVKPWYDVHGLFHDIEAFWYREAHQQAETRPTRNFHHFSGLDWTRWSGGEWWLALRGGRLGGNHGNLDLGQIILGTGTTRWLVDPGYGAGTTAQHNLPTIRNHPQTDRARGPTIRRHCAGKDLHLAINLREAHPFVLDRWVRHVLVLDERVAVLIDDLVGSDARRLSADFHLQIRGDVTINDDHVAVQQGDEHLRIVIDGSKKLKTKDWAWDDQPITALTWRPWPDTVSHIQTVFFLRDQAAVSIRHDTINSTITVDGQNWRLDRQRHSLERIHG
jgi:hypothetical protein